MKPPGALLPASKRGAGFGDAVHRALHKHSGKLRCRLVACQVSIKNVCLPAFAAEQLRAPRCWTSLLFNASRLPLESDWRGPGPLAVCAPAFSRAGCWLPLLRCGCAGRRYGASVGMLRDWVLDPFQPIGPKLHYLVDGVDRGVGQAHAC